MVRIINPGEMPEIDRRHPIQVAGEGILAWRKLGLPDIVAQKLPKLGFPAPRPIQDQVMPLAMRMKSFTAIAPTASGKTLAFLLPVIELWRRNRSKSLIIVPSQELADQCIETLTVLDPDHARLSKVLRGGVPLRTQAQDFSNQWRTIIGTPGRLLEWAEKRPKLFHAVDIGIWDEYDALLNMGFKPQLAKLWKQVSRRACIWCFSATSLQETSKSFPVAPKKQISFIPPEDTPDLKDQKFYLVTQARHKGTIIEQLLKQETQGSILIFARNRERVDHLTGLLKQNGFVCLALHGDLEPNARKRIFNDFQNKKERILVATDLASRGLDTLAVDTIINDSPPHNYKSYIHRAGRAGRSGQVCTIHTLASPEDYLTWKKLSNSIEEIPYVAGYDDLKKWLPRAKALHKKDVEQQHRLEERQAQSAHAT